MFLLTYLLTYLKVGDGVVISWLVASCSTAILLAAARQMYLVGDVATTARVIAY